MSESHFVLWYVKNCLELTQADIDLRRQWAKGSRGELKVDHRSKDDILQWLTDCHVVLSDRQSNEKLMAAIDRYKKNGNIVYLDLNLEVLWVSVYKIVEKPNYVTLKITTSDEPMYFDEQLLSSSRMGIAHTVCFADNRPGNLLIFLDDHKIKLDCKSMTTLFDGLLQIPTQGVMYCEWEIDQLECVMYSETK